ncbi:MAG: hypothetical protein E8D52_11345 [Nitrospira sp.]|nr:MAG: hypothetical protein E8D52_11345 [Nitrospira sp.]
MNSVLMLTRIIILLTLWTTYGCGANFNSIYRKFETEDDSVLIDAKQRVIAVTQSKTDLKDSSGKITATETTTRLCAEPSPDALSALSAAASASGSYKEISAQLAGSISEVASNIGIRTQSIQLLRDGMYRLCEAYMNGALDRKEYMGQQRRYQIMMSGLLAIESLTDVVTPKQVVLRGESAATTGRGILEAEKNVKEAKDNLKTAEDEEAKAKVALAAAKTAKEDYEKQHPDPATRTEEQNKKLKDLDDEVAASQKTLEHKTDAKNSKKTMVEEMQEILEAAKSLTAKSSTSGTIESGSCSRSCSTFTENNNDKMIDTVNSIVKDMFKPDMYYECIDFYKDGAAFQPATKTPLLTSLDGFCQSLFNIGASYPERFLPTPLLKTSNDLAVQRQGQIETIIDLIDALDSTKARLLADTPPVKGNPAVESAIDAAFPKTVRDADRDGKVDSPDVAKKMLKMRAALAERSEVDLRAWKAALRATQ